MALAGLTLAPAVARADEWELLGSRRVSFAAERDAIAVGLREGLFNAIRVEVADGNLEMFDMKITFGDGDTWSPNTRLVFRQGSRSRVIDLPGAARVIRRIVFAYRSTLRRGRATVHVYGRRATILPVAPPPVLTAPTGWDHIGARPVDFRVDHDVIMAAGQGAFRGVRFDVEGGDLEMFDVKLTFGNGETFSPQTRLYFRQGSRSRVIDLPFGARNIERIDFYYRSVPGGRQGRATVHVYGQR
jgi:hypothetical protein